MKTVRIVLSILAALAAIVGVIYVIATYGEKIAAWATNLLNSCKARFNRTKIYYCEDENLQACENDFEA